MHDAHDAHDAHDTQPGHPQTAKEPDMAVQTPAEATEQQAAQHAERLAAQPTDRHVTQEFDRIVTRERAYSGVALLGSPAARAVMAVSRISVGFIFLWAGLDKTFGLGYSTPPEAAWLKGNAPMQGFLEHGVSGPFAGFFPMLNTPLFNFLFMAGMFGVGLAMILGIGTRIAAVSGTFIMMSMWLATWPLAPGSSNPGMDYHVVYSLVLVLAALTYSGRTCGLGARWETLVGKQRWLV